MSVRSLPARPSLDQLKRQAKELQRAQREGKSSAAARIVAHHPRFKGHSPQAALARPLATADAQLVLAREYGFGNWAQLKHRVALGLRISKLRSHPRFDEAVAAMDRGAVEELRGLLASEPALVHARTNLEPPYGYFTGATLLHHVAGNPSRGGLTGGLPQNIVTSARLLLEAGADVNAATLGPAPSTSPDSYGATTMGLVLTSKQASDSGVAGPLMDLLLEYGATLDVTGEDALQASLANHAPRAAEKMIALGAKADLFAAAALGRMDLLRSCFDHAGRLRSLPRRGRKPMTERDAIGLALLFAYVNTHPDLVDALLEKDGNWNMIGVNNGTALHRAAWDGDLAMVQRLVAKGADVGNRDNPFVATPLSWARHNKQSEVFRWLRVQCAIDLHDAVCFDLREHVEARLREDPASVNRRIDQWTIPQCTPLHWAAWLPQVGVDGGHDPALREQLVALLLDSGADANVVAGNGLTALDIAHEAQAAGIAALLARHGAKHAADL
jgi:hypothetical protein